MSARKILARYHGRYTVAMLTFFLICLAGGVFLIRVVTPIFPNVFYNDLPPYMENFEIIVRISCGLVGTALLLIGYLTYFVQEIWVTPQDMAIRHVRGVKKVSISNIRSVSQEVSFPPRPKNSSLSVRMCEGRGCLILQGLTPQDNRELISVLRGINPRIRQIRDQRRKTALFRLMAYRRRKRRSKPPAS